MSYNFENGMPSASMPRPWEQVGYVDPLQQFSSLGNYGVPAQSSSPFLPQMSMDPSITKVDFTSEALKKLGSVSGSTASNGNGIMDWLKSAMGTKEAPGWGGMALGAASGLASTYLGLQQYGLAKDTLANNKQQFQMQYDAQKRMTNSNLEDRQRARVASNSGAYQSPSDYMSKYGVK